MPLWIEGPNDTKSGTLWGSTQVWGVPRLLGAIPYRDDLLLLLVRSKVISMSLLKRIVELKCALQLGEWKESLPKYAVKSLTWMLGVETFDLPDFDTFVKLHDLEGQI